MPNRKASEFPSITGSEIDEEDLLTLVHVFEVDPTLRNKRITFTQFKSYLDVYYSPISGATFSGNVVITGTLTTTGNLTATSNLTVSGSSALNTLTSSTFGLFSGNVYAQYIASSIGSSGLSYLLIGAYGATAAFTGTISFAVSTNGNVVNTNNSYGALSDIKLKENIVDAGSQWNDLKALQVRKYNFKKGQTHTQIGLISQEVELVSPGLVNEAPDRDQEGNDLSTVTKTVNYSVLYMKAVKALQEAMERIETLEVSNTNILTRLFTLEKV